MGDENDGRKRLDVHVDAIVVVVVVVVVVAAANGRDGALAARWESVLVLRLH